MCPKNLRTRLRPVNVCCAIVASHLRRPRREGEPSERAAAAAIRVEFFEPSLVSKSRFQAFRPDFVLRTVKTQNDARGALPHPPVTTSHFADCKKPEI
jgi:hypothetical protein